MFTSSSKKTSNIEQCARVPLHSRLRAPVGLLFDQDALPRFHELRGATAVGADGGSTTGHAFDEDHAERLFVGWEPEGLDGIGE